MVCGMFWGLILTEIWLRSVDDRNITIGEISWWNDSK